MNAARKLKDVRDEKPPKKESSGKGKEPKELRDQVLTDYMPLVTFEARRLMERLPPMVDIDDLVSSGTLGLIDALERFDPTREVKFKTYAVFRIRGAMLDFLRSNDDYPRTVRDFARELGRTSDAFRQAHGRSPSLSELAELLNCPLDDLNRKMAHLPSGQKVEIDAASEIEPQSADGIKVAAADEFYSMRERREALVEIISDILNEREKTVLQLYFWEELNLKEIARILEVTESRVSQILSHARRRVKARLKRHDVFAD